MNNFKYDIFRYYERFSLKVIEKFLISRELKFIKSYREANKFSKYPLIGIMYRANHKRLSNKYCCSIPYSTKIGKGFYIGHLSNIIINPNVIIGNNVNIAQGVTIGQENRGKRKGTPTIGNEVWIGPNAVIVGKILIGNDVLIAQNSYVNFDVPDHSIVLGNPGKILYKENATDGYINRKV